METVSQFICLCADKTVSHMIDFLIKFIQRNVLKLWHFFLHFCINRNPEILISSKNVLIKTGLALMDSHITAASRYRSVIIRIHILLKNRMTTLMDCRIHRTERIMFIKMISHTHIL